LYFEKALVKQGLPTLFHGVDYSTKKVAMLLDIYERMSRFFICIFFSSTEGVIVFAKFST